MSRTLSNGYILPEDGDFGLTWFDDLESNIQRVNDHNHDGVTGSRLPSTSITSVVIQIAETAFTPVATGGFEATLQANSTINFDDLTIYVRDATTKQQVFLDVLRVSSSEYKILTNTPLNYEVLLG